ncbi:hypothetical protein M441DRAFT_52785 [Trichoderma asperellum CBS 433.97]|uniref:Uncharacterized protein n=1 Tax=Trichoderma asperellum (strain ATCC 204424 / CBS 433.97 / NBRC 101777) TaxID=1042311 RepID=A0A2T3ZME8_TRIA4|nr:hypothetical protein M441DRAFT_52785 [Trichoderma asperellum CBS 433.97]PTB45978.1 hypothetical protein M441DRAFT_52785 [Trichoderma asperellum CBS 433.97]
MLATRHRLARLFRWVFANLKSSDIENQPMHSIINTATLCKRRFENTRPPTTQLILRSALLSGDAKKRTAALGLTPFLLLLAPLIWADEGER